MGGPGLDFETWVFLVNVFNPEHPGLKSETWATHSSLEVAAYFRQSLQGDLRFLPFSPAAESHHSDRMEIRAVLTVEGRRNEVVEQVVKRLSFEPGVSVVSWSIVPMALE